LRSDKVQDQEPVMRLFISAVLCVLWSAAAWSGTLKPQEAAKLRSDIVTMYKAFEKGNPEPLIANVHESIYTLVGGREAFGKISRDALQQLLKLNIKFLSSDVGMPTETYPAGDEEVCFVPRMSVLELQGKRAKTTTFMIAIRRVGTTTWKYLDGAGLRKNPELLPMLLPKLSKDAKLPPNTVEML
jgi:hypothetical protein